MSKAVGVTADMIIDLHDYDILRPLVEAIIRHENGRGPLKTLNTWYAAEVIEEGLRRAGVVKPVKTVKAVPVTKETAGATVTAGIGLAQLADVMPQVSAAMDKAQGHILAGYSTHHLRYCHYCCGRIHCLVAGKKTPERDGLIC